MSFGDNFQIILNNLQKIYKKKTFVVAFLKNYLPKVVLKQGLNIGIYGIIIRISQNCH